MIKNIKENDRLNRNFPSLALIVPCYNETEALSHCVEILNDFLSFLIKHKKINQNSYILFVDDGSQDLTWERIKEASQRFEHISGIKLSANRGQQIAMMAALAYIDTDISVTIDVDLQDDIHCVETMIDKYQQGCEIVYGVRHDRFNDSFFKRHTANFFYRFMTLLGVNHIPNHSEFRLLSQRAAQCLLQYTERNIYIRGILPSIGFKTDKVFYSRQKRIVGETKYSLQKLISLALEAITSFSIIPLRIICILGFLTCFFSFLAILYTLVSKLRNYAVPGWTSTALSIFFLSGVQLLSLGVIGEYIGKIYIEVKNRPKYFIEEIIQNKIAPR